MLVVIAKESKTSLPKRARARTWAMTGTGSDNYLWKSKDRGTSKSDDRWSYASKLPGNSKIRGEYGQKAEECWQKQVAAVDATTASENN